MNTNPDFYQRCVRSAPLQGLPCIPLSAIHSLERALVRYMAAIGVIDSSPEDADVAQDRANLGHLLEKTASGIPLLSADSQAAFMHAVSQLPLSWCATWAYKDWIQTVANGCVDGDAEQLIADGYRDALRIASSAPPGATSVQSRPTAHRRAGPADGVDRSAGDHYQVEDGVADGHGHSSPRSGAGPGPTDAREHGQIGMRGMVFNSNVH